MSSEPPDPDVALFDFIAELRTMIASRGGDPSDVLVALSEAIKEFRANISWNGVYKPERK